MHDIIFINPPTDTTTFEGRLARKGGILPPLGLLALAAYVRKEGFKVALLDAFGLGLSFDDTVKKVLSLKTKTIGLTAFTTTIDNAATIARKIKDECPEANIILGGNHLSALPFETMNRFSQFDVGILGEGEITVTELLRRENRPQELIDISGLIYKDNGRLITTQKRKRIDDLDQLPFPAFDLLSDFPNRYSAVATNFKNLPTTSLVATRGCPYQCTFCDRHVFGNVCRGHSTGYIIALIKDLQNKYGLKDISFYDDTFIVFKKRLQELCQKMISEKINISWSCLGRVDLIDPDILKLMKEAGCWQISYGIESGNQAILDLYHKHITVSQILKAIRMTREAGLNCRGFFMLANPMETSKTIKETAALARSFDDICVTFFTPLPGTEIYGDIKKYGEATLDWGKMDMFIPNFIPQGLTKRYILRIYRRIHLKFYLRPKIICYYLLKTVRNRNIGKIFSGADAFFQLIFRKKFK